MKAGEKKSSIIETNTTIPSLPRRSKRIDNRRQNDPATNYIKGAFEEQPPIIGLLIKI